MHTAVGPYILPTDPGPKVKRQAQSGHHRDATQVAAPWRVSLSIFAHAVEADGLLLAGLDEAHLGELAALRHQGMEPKVKR